MSKERYQAVAQILRATKAQIAAILVASEDELHKLKLEQNLQRDIDYILLVTGAGDLQEGSTTALGPAKTIGGKPIGKIRTITEADLVPSDDKVYNLKLQVEAALDYFSTEANSAGILANIPDLVIRGVAKKAGLKVTKDEPKELTVEFIDEIKAALHPAGNDTGSQSTEQPNVETETETTGTSSEKVQSTEGAAYGNAIDANQPNSEQKKTKAGK